MKAKLFITAAAVAALAAPAFAAPVSFFGEDVVTNGGQGDFTNATAARNNFFANLNGVGTETFESIPTGTTPPIAINFQGAGTATLNGSGQVQTGPDGAGRYAFSGDNYYTATAGSTANSFSVDFSAPISAFGFYATDIGDYSGQLTLQLTDSLGNITTLLVPHTVGANGDTSGSDLYFGFYDTSVTYTSIAFLNSSGGGDTFGFDDLSGGSRTQVQPSVPEPASWAMMIGGFGLVGGALRRRSTSVRFA